MFSYNRFLHFVFADETDSYFIESGTGVRFRFYLWYRLCQDEFKEIYFLGGTRQNLRIEFLDPASFYAYGSKPFLGVFGKAKSYDRNDRVRQVENPARYCDWMEKQLKKGRQAFVIPLDVFESLASGAGGERFLDGLINLAGQKTESAVILTAPIQGEETRRLLGGPAFEHCDGNGRRLCPELYEILHRKERAGLYEALFEELDGAAVFLHVYDKEQIRSLVRAVQFKQEREICGEVELEAVAEYLYCWCRSRNLRESSAVLPFPKKSLRFADLYSQLQNETAWRKLRKAAASFHVSRKSDRIETLYPDLGRRLSGFYCGEADCYRELARAADGISLGAYREYGGPREEILRFEDFRDQLHEPSNWKLSGKVEEYVLRYLAELCRTLDPGFAEGDDLMRMEEAGRVSQILEAVSFGRQHLWEEPGAEEKEELLAICELYQQYLDISKTKCRYGRKRRQLKQAYDELLACGEEDAELALRLENAWKKEQFFEHAEKEAKKRILQCEEDLEEQHFETIREVIREWRTEKPESRQITAAALREEKKNEETDPLQEKYDLEAARRIADLVHYH
ncbi:MAG: hypothetical protein HFI65_06285 [Lachnospiraceae bacterium]|nr:hypothetical protein [Lachnospiraceae bacterium]